MSPYEGVGKRVRERLLALGYVQPNGEPDVQRFSWDHRFGRAHVHAWMADKMAPFKHLVRLCVALECSMEWLLTGAERPKAHPRQGRGAARKLLLALSVGAGLLWPSPSVAGRAGTLAVLARLNPLHLIGSWRRRFSILSVGVAAA